VKPGLLVPDSVPAAFVAVIETLLPARVRVTFCDASTPLMNGAVVAAVPPENVEFAVVSATVPTNVVAVLLSASCAVSLIGKGVPATIADRGACRRLHDEGCSAPATTTVLARR
jgi:hypothetical protein